MKLDRKTIFVILVIAFSFTTTDVIQSYRLQTMAISPYSEANPLPNWFFSHGVLGYFAYFFVEFPATFFLMFSIYFVIECYLSVVPKVVKK